MRGKIPAASARSKKTPGTTRARSLNLPRFARTAGLGNGGFPDTATSQNTRPETLNNIVRKSRPSIYVQRRNSQMGSQTYAGA